MPLSNVTILLVEDSAEVRRTVRAMLTEMKITQVHEAENGKDALSYVDELMEGIDLIICDWNMPHKTGIELLKEVRQTQPNLPFLMITARSDQESVEAAIDSKVTGYIRKPFSYDELQSKVMKILKIKA